MNEVMILARWLASKAVKAEWKAMGRKPQYAEPNEISEATNVYLIEHRNELLREAWDHPVALKYRHQEQMRLARKAVIAEIRDRGGRVNSIEPAEIRKLAVAYLKEHRWENVIMERGCV